MMKDSIVYSASPKNVKIKKIILDEISHIKYVTAFSGKGIQAILLINCQIFVKCNCVCHKYKHCFKLVYQTEIESRFATSEQRNTREAL